MKRAYYNLMNISVQYMFVSVFFYVRVRVRVRVHVCGADTEYNPQKQTLFNLIKLCFIAEENIFFLIK